METKNKEQKILYPDKKQITTTQIGNQIQKVRRIIETKAEELDVLCAVYNIKTGRYFGERDKKHIQDRELDQKYNIKDLLNRTIRTYENLEEGEEIVKNKEKN